MGLFDIFKINEFKNEIAMLTQEKNNLESKFEDLGLNTLLETKERIKKIEREHEYIIQQKKQEIIESSKQLDSLNISISEQSNQLTKLEKKIKTSNNRLIKTKKLYDSMKYSLDAYQEMTPQYESLIFSKIESEDLELFAPTVTLKLNHMNIKDLRKAFRENDKAISNLLESYSARYTTKGNKAIYSLMVIALRAELQNILSNLKYEKLDTAIEQVKALSTKYLSIAGEGNQSIAGTLAKFIGEIEYLFINAIKIEYNYYVKKEQEKQEKLALREQQRQEAQERKELLKEKKRIENEEKKFLDQIDLLKAQSEKAEEKEKQALLERLKQLEAQLSSVILKKEEIANLQHGKAGTVYIISNLGAFGEKIFKVGMTRRLDPMDRINELGNASLPFKYDVHSFIFSDNAVELESKLHEALNNRRLNKVNLRKEFFVSSIEEMEELVTQFEPTAEFVPEMKAADYKQSLSSDENYTSEYHEEYSDDDDDDFTEDEIE